MPYTGSKTRGKTADAGLLPLLVLFGQGRNDGISVIEQFEQALMVRTDSTAGPAQGIIPRFCALQWSLVIFFLVGHYDYRGNPLY